MTVCGRVPFPSHDSGRLHGYGNSLGAVQAVGGVIEGPAWAQPQAETVRSPHPTMRVPPLVVSVLGGLGAALGRDGDEGFGGGARWDRRRGLLVVGCVGDGWKKQKDIIILKVIVSVDSMLLCVIIFMECEKHVSLKCQLFKK